MPLQLNYFKRYRMEAELRRLPPVEPLPAGYAWVPWDDTLVERHAAVKARCFADTVDADVFPSLGTPAGCLSLMRAIWSRPEFLTSATWLIARGPDDCGTVQGVRERAGLGAIQNVGVTAEHRGRGLGAALVLLALHGFRDQGLRRAVLEVTAQNHAAVRLYRRLGFRCVRTVYKAVEAPDGTVGVSLPLVR